MIPLTKKIIHQKSWLLKIGKVYGHLLIGERTKYLNGGAEVTQGWIITVRKHASILTDISILARAPTGPFYKPSPALPKGSAMPAP